MSRDNTRQRSRTELDPEPTTDGDDLVDSDAAGQETATTEAHNEAVLRGRVAAPVDQRELPSGDTIMTARLIVDRDPAAMARSSQRVDTIDCVAWLRRVQRSMRAWQAGDRVEVTGAIRRRFFRSANG